MGTHVIKMPDLGEGIAEVELVAWHIKVGDVVAEDQILADVMTDKATVEIPSDVAGTVVSLNAAVGEVVAVGTEIIRIEAQNEALAPEDKALNAIKTVVNSTPSTVDDQGLTTTVQHQSVPSAKHIAPAANHRPIAAPAVRRRAIEQGIDLSTICGTGPDKRVTQLDLDTQASLSRPGTAANLASSVPTDQRFTVRSDETVMPVIGLRRKIAQKMQESKQHIPHFTYVEEIDVTELEDLRARLNAQYGATRGRLTLLPFLIRAMVLAARDHPEVNARYDDTSNNLTRFGAVHLGLATQTSNGLMVPVIRHAESLDLWLSAAAVLQVSEAARSGKASREDLTGSTITLTSLGALGGIVSTPVINYPEVAIVGTNRIVDRPMIKGGLVVGRKMMNLSSSFDHRVVDGMNAAEFIQQIRGYLECPGTLLV